MVKKSNSRGHRNHGPKLTLLRLLSKTSGRSRGLLVGEATAVAESAVARVTEIVTRAGVNTASESTVVGGKARGGITVSESASVAVLAGSVLRELVTRTSRAGRSASEGVEGVVVGDTSVSEATRVTERAVAGLLKLPALSGSSLTPLVATEVACERETSNAQMLVTTFVAELVAAWT